MIVINRPFLLGSNLLEVNVFANEKLLCTIAPQGKKNITLKNGEYTFRVESKIFKSKDTAMTIVSGDKLSIGAPKLVILVPLIPVILLAGYFGFDVRNEGLALVGVFVLTLFMLLLFLFYKNNYYSIKKGS